MPAHSNNVGVSGVVPFNPLQWAFLDEPLWRWLVFLIAINLLLTAWNGVIRLMK